MQRILQINIAGRLVPIEEDAYHALKEYISALERQFTGADGKEIIEDIENRIAELFGIRLQGGAHAIDRADVRKVIETLGAPADLHDGGHSSAQSSSGYQGRQSHGHSQQYSGSAGSSAHSRQVPPRPDRLLRDPYNKVLGGVCSGLAHYFDIDPVIIRLIMVALFFSFGIGLLAYIIAWAVIPAARSADELNYGQPVSFHDITRNVGAEMEDLKRRGEQMSRDLKDFFSNKR